MIDMCECEIIFFQSYTFLLPMFHHRRSEETMRMMYPLYMGNSSHYHNLDGVPLLVNVSFMLNPSVWKLLWINNVFAGIQRFLSEQLVYQNNWCSVLILFFLTQVGNLKIYSYIQKKIQSNVSIFQNCSQNIYHTTKCNK